MKQVARIPTFAVAPFAVMIALAAAPIVHSQTLEWTRQLGTSSEDNPLAASADGLGNFFVSGYTRGNLGGTNAGSADAFVAKYGAGGTLQWTRQLGTSAFDGVSGSWADGLGNVYIFGDTSGNLAGTDTLVVLHKLMF